MSRSELGLALAGLLAAVVAPGSARAQLVDDFNPPRGKLLPAGCGADLGRISFRTGISWGVTTPRTRI